MTNQDNKQRLEEYRRKLQDEFFKVSSRIKYAIPELVTSFGRTYIDRQYYHKGALSALESLIDNLPETEETHHGELFTKKLELYVVNLKKKREEQIKYLEDLKKNLYSKGGEMNYAVYEEMGWISTYYLTISNNLKSLSLLFPELVNFLTLSSKIISNKFLQ